MAKPKIRRATIDDIYVLQALGKQTFTDAFAKDNTEEDIREYVDNAFALNRLTTEMNNTESEFYLAYHEDDPIGYLKINYGIAQTEALDLKAMEMERIYVQKDYQGKKIGQQLFYKTLERAQDKNTTYLWLGVWEKNLSAIQFYHRYGFSSFSKHSFLLGKDLQTDILMRIEVTPGRIKQN